MSSLKRFLLYFAQENVEFRYPEIASLIKFFNLNIKVPSFGDRPYWILEDVSESDLRKIASRSVSLRYVVEIYGSGKTYNSFHDNLKRFIPSIDKHSIESSFRMTVETYNKHIKHAEKIQRIESLDYLPLTGKIDLKNADTNFIYFEYWGFDPKNVPVEPEEIVFGRWIVDGQRDIVNTISLKNRKFIGNTSMNPTLSLLMANQGLCDKNQLTFDPFVGTGSLLISAAFFGSYVLGCDIDFMMLHGKSKPTRVNQKIRSEGESIKANLVQYNLQHLYLDVFVADFSNCPLGDHILFDAIITDPPYGIREAIESIVPKESKKSTVLNEDIQRYPSTSNYSFKKMFDDLLRFSFKHLRLGGRLVCWFPIGRNDYQVKLLPQHSALTLVANSEQKLCGETTRRLLTYEKVAESGETVYESGLEKIDFRVSYFGDGSRQEKRAEKYERNLVEAKKRGKIFENKMEMKKMKNKQSLQEREKDS